MSAKPRPDAKLLNLPHHQQDALVTWLLDEGLSYRDAQARLHLDFNVQTSLAALSNFWQRVVSPLRLRRAAQAAEGFPEAAGGLGTDWAAPSKAMVRQRYFELLASPHTSAEELGLFAKMIAAISVAELEAEKLRTRRQGIAVTAKNKRRELTLAKEKFVASLRTKLETGLNALFEEIKGNEKAERIFAGLQEAIAKKA